MNQERLKNRILGMEGDDVLIMLERFNYPVRITKINNTPMICTRDYISRRFNLNITDGHVTGVTFG